MKHNPGFLKLVEQAKRTIKECRIADVKVKLDRGDPFHFIDVREDNEFAKDHAKGAAHLGRGILERDIETVIPDKRSEIIIYCGGRAWGACCSSPTGSLFLPSLSHPIRSPAMGRLWSRSSTGRTRVPHSVPGWRCWAGLTD